MISTDDLLFFVDDAVDGMVAIVEELGDDLANARPDIHGANSPYVVLTHCLGVLAYWGGEVIAGRPAHRVRADEFRARGTVADLVVAARAAQAQFHADLATIAPSAPPRIPVDDPDDAASPIGRTQGGAAVHVYEELAQHRGQMEITRDVLLAPWRRAVGPGGEPL